MNKQDEDKALKITEEISENREFECDSLDIYKGAMKMAAWKEQQMIEKAVEYLEPIFKNLAGYSCGGDLTNDFKKYMEEN